MEISQWIDFRLTKTNFMFQSKWEEGFLREHVSFIQRPYINCEFNIEGRYQITSKEQNGIIWDSQIPKVVYSQKDKDK